MAYVLTVVAVLLVLLTGLRFASLAHGIWYLWSAKALITLNEVRNASAAGHAVDWEAAERTAGHKRLFGGFLASVKPVWLRSIVHLAWRGWVFTVWVALACIALEALRTRTGSLDSYTAVVAAGGAVLVGGMLVLHEICKRWKFGSLTEYHWSGTAPGVLKSGVAVKESAFGVMAVFVLLPGIYVSFLAFIYGLVRADGSLLTSDTGQPLGFLDVVLFTFFSGDAGAASNGVLLVRGVMLVVLFIDLTVVPAIFALPKRDGVVP